jgi:hypothetical protein
MMNLLEQLDDLLTDPIILNPSYSAEEVTVNYGILSCQPGDGLDIFDECEARLVAASKNWLSRARKAYPDVGQATFYAWYDEQSGCLKVCMTSRLESDLPFGCNVALLDNPRPIMQQLFADDSPGVISLDELKQITTEAEHDQAHADYEAFMLQYVLAVWVNTEKW